MTGVRSEVVRDGVDLRADVRETHISILFFAGERVYKMRKAVRLGFLDFEDAEARKADCAAEVELNRRLAPDVYLGVGGLVDERGEENPAVVMRRLPDERALSELVSSGADVSDEVRQVAHTIAAFHERAERSPAISAAASPEAVARRFEDLFAEARPYVGGALEAEANSFVQRLVPAYLDGRRRLFEQRVSDGRICDGHGDIQASDVFCLDDGPRILDCIEFGDELRHVDVVEDVAFLAMDLEQMGALPAAEQLVRRYCELTGETAPRSLWHFYIAERAYVRAVVTCLRGAQRGAVDAGAARGFLKLARRHVGLATVRLVLVGGLPASGKSTVADGLADACEAVVLRTDEVRHDIHADVGGPQAAVEDRYSAAAVSAVYARLLEEAGTLLSTGQSVVLDATWWSEHHRVAARKLAEQTSSELHELRCEANESVATERLCRRDREGSRAASGSEATVAVRAAMAGRYEPWPGSTVLDTSGSPAKAVEAAVRVVFRDL